MKKRNDVRHGFVFVFLSMLIAGCASVRNLPDKILLGAPFSEMYSELNIITDVDRIGRQEIVVRFTGTALFGVDKYSLRAKS